MHIDFFALFKLITFYVGCRDKIMRDKELLITLYGSATAWAAISSKDPYKNFEVCDIISTLTDSLLFKKNGAFLVLSGLNWRDQSPLK